MTPAGATYAPGPTPTRVVATGHPDEMVWSPRRRHLLLVVGAVVLGLWLVGLVTFSTLLYHRNFLSWDFGAYNQAWTLIGQGHLNPLNTVIGKYPFVKSDFELILWPLALIHVVYPHPVVLLWIQDLGVAASGWVVYKWTLEWLERRKVAWWPAAGVAVIVLAALIANPGVYQTLLFDVHMEPISIVFVVLAGRDLWRGRHRRAWLWVGITLLFGSFAAITLVGLGLSALLAGRDTRRPGGLLIAVALGWLALISAIGADAGSGISNYAYLAGRSTLPVNAGLVLVTIGAVMHPTRVIDQLHARLHDAYTLIKPVGVIGLASAWGFGVPFVVLMADALNSSSGFMGAQQNFAVFPFVLLGTVMVLVWLAQRFRFGWVPAMLIAAAVTAQALSYGVTTSPGTIRWAVSQVGPGPAAQLRKALAITPPHAETIVSFRVMGRFAGRRSAYPFHANGLLRVQSHSVVFVFDPAAEGEMPNASPADDIAAIAYVRDRLHARTLVDAEGIWAFLWHPPAGTTEITIPGPPTG
ncbi:MAG: DUF2079 domain-containing protein [Acidimicrobiales bacterium]